MCTPMEYSRSSERNVSARPVRRHVNVTQYHTQITFYLSRHALPVRRKNSQRWTYNPGARKQTLFCPGYDRQPCASNLPVIVFDEHLYYKTRQSLFTYQCRPCLHPVTVIHSQAQRTFVLFYKEPGRRFSCAKEHCVGTATSMGFTCSIQSRF